MSSFLSALQQFFGSVAFWIMVQPWEQAIRVRAGKHVRRLAPGFHWRIPILDDVQKQTVRLRAALIPTQTLSTSDGHTLVVGATLAYVISDIEKLYRGLHHAEDTVSQLAASAIAAEVFGTTRADLRPKQVAERVDAALAEQLSPYGIADVGVRITDFAFVRAFRLVQESRWAHGSGLKTEAAQR